MNLVVPSLEHKSLFIDFYHDYVNSHKPSDVERAEEVYAEGKNDFSSYIQRLSDESKGINLQPGFVPSAHYWLMDDQNVMVGAIRLRHSIDGPFLSVIGGHIGYDIAPSYQNRGLGKLMLKMILPEARALGLDRVLITADESNIASRKVIEANGGQLENIVTNESLNPGPIARYWVDLTGNL